MPINTTLHRLSRAGLASDAGKGSSGMESWEWGMSPSPVWNNLSISSPGAWDDPRWKGKLLLEHHPRRSQLYRALSHCHKQGQCCPPPHTSSMSMSSGAPSRKQPLLICIEATKRNLPCVYIPQGSTSFTASIAKNCFHAVYLSKMLSIRGACLSATQTGLLYHCQALTS